jgi:hypothetical protein
MHASAPETVAYQRLRLREIRERYEELTPDLDRYLRVEGNVSEEIDALDSEFDEVRKTLISLGVDLDAKGAIRAPGRPVAPMRPKSRASEPPPSVSIRERLDDEWTSTYRSMPRPLA